MEFAFCGPKETVIDQKIDSYSRLNKIVCHPNEKRIVRELFRTGRHQTYDMKDMDETRLIRRL